MQRAILNSVFTLLLLGFCTCNTKRNEAPDGGFCAYDTMVVRARVTAIIESGATTRDAILVLEGNCKEYASEDTIWLSNQLDRLLTVREMDSLKIYEGAQFKYIIRNIREGHCTDHLEDLTLEKY